jgi:DNA-binding NtrC family response regulator
MEAFPPPFTYVAKDCQKDIRGRMTPSVSSDALFLLVADSQPRELLVNFLEAKGYAPLALGHPGEMVKTLKRKRQATVFVDCLTVGTYGPGLYAKIKVACPASRVVLLCDKNHHEHRDLVKEAMDLGIYACLLAPFAEWEILAMVRRSQGNRPAGRRPTRTREKR